MLIRSVLLTGSVLALLAPGAPASVSRHIVPVATEADGLRLVETKRGGLDVRLGPKAGALYRRHLRGRRVTSGCITNEGDAEVHSSDAPIRAPRGRTRFRAHLTPTADLCMLSTRKRRREGTCVKGLGTRNTCARVLFALTEDGQRRVDEFARTWDLLVVYGALLFGGDRMVAQLRELYPAAIVELDSADATPPVGVAGFWRTADGFGAVVLTAGGKRWFVRLDDGVYSTNVEAFHGPGDVPSL